MESITKNTPEELEKMKHEFYNVIIGDTNTGCLHMTLKRQEFEAINVYTFIDLGFIVTVHKTYDYV